MSTLTRPHTRAGVAVEFALTLPFLLMLLSGVVDYVTTLDGAVVCDARIELQGTPYTGTCAGCDFAFEIDATVVRDSGTADCELHPYLSYIDAGVYTNMLMAHMASYSGSYGSYSDVFATGFAVDYSSYGYGYYPGPYWFMLSYDGSSTGSFRRTGDDIEWTFTYESTESYGDASYYSDCGTVGYADLGDSVVGTYTGQSELDCSTDEVDVWTFLGAPGQTALIAVDTTATTTAFDPLMWVNDPAGCTLNSSDDSFDCTYPPPSYQCPSMTLSLADRGLYQVVVASYGSCAGSIGAYELTVDLGGVDPSLTLLHDDADRYAAGSIYAFDISGQATIVE